MRHFPHHHELGLRCSILNITPGLWAKGACVHALCRRVLDAARLRSDGAPGLVVGPATPGISWPLYFFRLRQLGGFPGKVLFLGTLPVAVLLSGAVRRFAA